MLSIHEDNLKITKGKLYKQTEKVHKFFYTFHIKLSLYISLLIEYANI